MRRERGVVALALVLGALLAHGARAADWTPGAWADASTLELRTQCPGEEPHWFPVWLVVIDDQVYVRLGSKATARVQCSTAQPFLGVKVGGQTFDRVRGTEAPEMVGPVAAAMRRKYWSDLVVAWMAHPLTLRLTPE